MTAKFDDAYLKDRVDNALINEAYAEVDTFGTFSAEWRDRLVVPQAYIMVCLRNQASEDDLYDVKYKRYSKELDRLLVHARSATPDTDGNIPSIFGIPLERS